MSEYMSIPDLQWWSVGLPTAKKSNAPVEMEKSTTSMLDDLVARNRAAFNIPSVEVTLPTSPIVTQPTIAMDNYTTSADLQYHYAPPKSAGGRVIPARAAPTKPTASSGRGATAKRSLDALLASASPASAPRQKRVSTAARY